MFEFHLPQPAYKKLGYQVLSVFSLLFAVTFTFIFLSEGEINIFWGITICVGYYNSYIAYKNSKLDIYTYISDQWIEFNHLQHIILAKSVSIEWSQVTFIDFRLLETSDENREFIVLLEFDNDMDVTQTHSMSFSFFGSENFKQLIKSIKAKRNEIPFSKEFDRVELQFEKLYSKHDHNTF